MDQDVDHTHTHTHAQFLYYVCLCIRIPTHAQRCSAFLGKSTKKQVMSKKTNELTETTIIQLFRIQTLDSIADGPRFLLEDVVITCYPRTPTSPSDQSVFDRPNANNLSYKFLEALRKSLTRLYWNAHVWKKVFQYVPVRN